MNTILYVDDEESFLEMGREYLHDIGDFTVKTSRSATEGLRLLEQEPFDAIISDYQMPKMNGIQFLNRVRLRFGSIPFILLTGKSREEIEILALNSGADFYLQKGGDAEFLFTELAHTVRKSIQRQRAGRALNPGEE